jgi:imidazoleglycerol-phosphate dehydratase
MAAARESGGARARVRATVPGSGRATVQTGLPVLDHALELLARYAGFDLEVDVAADASPEEVAAVGRLLGQELAGPLAASGVRGYGSGTVPADEALAHVALEASGRPLLVSNVDLSRAHLAGLHTDLISRFLRELAEGGGLTVHVRLIGGEDTQHVVDAIFKSLGAALGQACGKLRRATAP